MNQAFTAEQNNFINSGKFCVVGIISPKTGFPHLTPTGIACYNNKLYVGVMTDTAKYRFMKKGSNKVGIAILESINTQYVSVIGYATILYKSTTESFETLMRKILENYEKGSKVEKQLKSIMIGENWVLLEIKPEKIVSINQRGGL